jgi:DNA-binding response OmpR family regulator
MKILLLEDNLKLNKTIKKRLEMKNYIIDSFIDGQDAYDAVQNNYTCFLLDINVPNVNGIKILKRIREYYKQVPVIIISASVELDLIKKSYDFGCNDYIKKPFFIDELEIKIEQLCDIKTELIQFDVNSYFNSQSSTIIINNNEIRLTKKERLLLTLLLNKKDNIVTYQEIENSVWEGNYVSAESIRSLIRRVRKILDNKYIETILETGYIFKIN